MNYPDENIFYLRPRTRSDDKFVMIYPGTPVWHQGLDIAIKALVKIREKATSAELHIYGRGPEITNLQRLAHQFALEDRVHFKDGMQLTEIAGCNGQCRHRNCFEEK